MKNWKKGLLSVTLFGMTMITASATSTETNQDFGLQVNTKQGIVEGFEEDGIKKFLGVPFATPPVGELRWKAPQSPAPWKGVKETKNFGPDPMQPNIFGDMNFRGEGRSEDCLYLNIWTPATRTNEKLPVLIYFNGGGLMAGSGSEPRYDGCAIAKEGVIGITANYREGIFGYFAHEELSAETEYKGSGNYGFLDQVEAIKWVKENIEAFGGDPNRITIAGESAGSFSVTMLMTSPLSKNNIAGVILSSGAEVMPNKPMQLSAAEAQGKATLARKGIKSIAEARGIPADSLQKLFPPMGMGHPVLDGYFFTESTDEVFIRGNQAQVPMLAGWNSMEGDPLQSLGRKEPTIANYKNALRMRFGNMTDEIFEAYGLLTDKDLFSQKALNLASDLFTGFGTWKVCDYHAKTSKQPVYRYKYMHARPQVSAKMGDKVAALAGGVRDKTEDEKKADKKTIKRTLGAVHSADIEYAMGNLATNEFYDWQKEDYEISKIFLSFYANFCKYGNPNGKGLPKWTPINGKLDKAPVMQIDVKSKEKCDAKLENAYRTLEKFYKSR